MERYSSCFQNFLKEYKSLTIKFENCFQEIENTRNILIEAVKKKNFEKYLEFLKQYQTIIDKKDGVCKELDNETHIWRLIGAAAQKENLYIRAKKGDKTLEHFFFDFLVNVYSSGKENESQIYSLFEKIVKDSSKYSGIGYMITLLHLSLLFPETFPVIDEKICSYIGYGECKFYRRGTANQYKMKTYFGKMGSNTLSYEYVKYINKIDTNQFRFSTLLRYYGSKNCDKNIHKQSSKQEMVNTGKLTSKPFESEFSACNTEYIRQEIEDIKDRILISNNQVILYGPIGTGKTFLASCLAETLSGSGNKLNATNKYVTFHPSYEYEDFVEGLFPETNNGKISYYVRNGIFKRMALQATIAALKKVCSGESMGSESLKKLCEDPCFKRIGASKLDEFLEQMEKDEKCINKIMDCTRWRGFKDWDSLPKFVLVIDEINRADLSRVFGELITLLEKDKRLGGENCITVTLPYSREKFGVPPNLYIVGTMNTTDRSIALIDLAVRRRFAFKEIGPDPSLLEGIVVKGINIEELLKKLNESIIKKKGRDYQIGHAFFIKLVDENLSNEEKERLLIYIWNNQIAPLLEEIFYGRDDDLEYIVGKELYDDKGEKKVKRIKDVTELGAILQEKQ